MTRETHPHTQCIIVIVNGGIWWTGTGVDGHIISTDIHLHPPTHTHPPTHACVLARTCAHLSRDKDTDNISSATCWIHFIISTV